VAAPAVSAEPAPGPPGRCVGLAVREGFGRLLGEFLVALEPSV